MITVEAFYHSIHMRVAFLGLLLLLASLFERSARTSELDGFVEDVSEYRTSAANCKAPYARIVATVPSAGAYYPAIIFYDGSESAASP